MGGENIKWTFEKCKEEAAKYNTRTEFATNSNSAYNAARRYKWMKQICFHMKVLRDWFPKNYWTKDRCQKEALKHKQRNEFGKKSSGAYMACLRNGWLNELCIHMNNKKNK